MARVFSFAAWNVEHFKSDAARVQRCVEFLAGTVAPDVFAIFEVEGKEVFSEFVTRMPGYNFFITEGLQEMETLVGVRAGFTAFVTQRHELKSDVPALRPGALVTLPVGGTYYSLLFVHLKSSDSPLSWGLRDDMVGHVLNLKKALDAGASSLQGANFLCVGDLNTMGLNVTYASNDMTGQQEVTRYASRFEVRGMTLVPKDRDVTWWGGSGQSRDPSDIDHVFASSHLDLRRLGDAGAGVSVLGWPQLNSEADRDEWIASFSDHALLFGEVHA